MLPQPGSWVRWVTAEFAREGEVIHTEGVSMIVRWLGGDQPQVFPLATVHFEGHADMEVIPRPPRASKVDRQMARKQMGVAAAAARYGITEKRVRQRLRNGSLQGRRENGKWVEVWDAED